MFSKGLTKTKMRRIEANTEITRWDRSTYLMCDDGLSAAESFVLREILNEIKPKLKGEKQKHVRKILRKLNSSIHRAQNW